MSKEEEWEVCDLKWNKYRTTLSINKLSKVRNTFCISCGTPHRWVRVDATEYKGRMKALKLIDKSLPKFTLKEYQKDLDSNITKLVADNFWDLI